VARPTQPPARGIEDSGARGLDRALGVLLDGVAMRGSCGRVRSAAPRRRHGHLRSVLFSLDIADYPHATRKVASWSCSAWAAWHAITKCPL